MLSSPPRKPSRKSRLVALGLAGVASLGGCAHRARPAPPSAEAEARKCDLVRTLLATPETGRLLGDLRASDEDGLVPVRVFVAQPEQGWLQRLFAGEPQCAGAGFHVVQDSTGDALVLLLQPANDGGYDFDARRAGPEELWLAGRPQGHVAPSGSGGWSVGGS